MNIVKDDKMTDLEKVNFKIVKTEKKEDSAKYKITLRIPLTLGWIEGVKFLIESNSGS